MQQKRAIPLHNRIAQTVGTQLLHSLAVLRNSVSYAEGICIVPEMIRFVNRVAVIFCGSGDLQAGADISFLTLTFAKNRVYFCL